MQSRYINGELEEGTPNSQNIDYQRVPLGERFGNSDDDAEIVAAEGAKFKFARWRSGATHYVRVRPYSDSYDFWSCKMCLSFLS